MKNKKDIVVLVLSLTGRERRFFKKTFDSNNEFVKLFDFIVKKQSFSVPEFNKYLAEKQGRSTLYTSGYISTLRQYLKDKILEVLRKIHGESDARMSLWNNLLVHRVLNSKGLLDLGFNQLSDTFEERDSLFPVDRLILLQQYSIYRFSTEVKGTSFDDINLIYEERKTIVKQHMNEIELSRAISILSICLQKNISDSETIKSVENLPILSHDPNDFCFTNKYIFFWIESIIFLLKGEFGNGFKKFNQVINLWIENPKMINAYPDIFIGTCQYYLKIIQSRYPGNYKIADFDYIYSVLDSLRKVGKDINQSGKFEQFFSFFETVIFFGKDDFEKVIESEPEVNKLISANLEITDFSKVYFLFILAHSNWRLQRFNETLEKLEEIIFDKEKAASNPLYYSKANLLYLMTHVCLRNWTFVENEWKKREKAIKKYTTIGEVEITFFDYLKQFFLKKNRDRREDLTKEFFCDLSEKMKDRKIFGSYHDLPFQEWGDNLLKKNNLGY